MSIFNPAEKFRIFQHIPPSSGFVADSTGLYVSMKYANKAYLILNMNQGSESQLTVTPYQASDVAGTGAKVLSTSVDIWVSSSRSDTPTKRTAAANFTLSTSTGAMPHPKQCIFEIDPGLAMDVNNGFDCLGVQVNATSSENTYNVFSLIDLRYPASAMVLTSD